MKKIHFIAIGGAIMHQLAIALHKKGNIITGSDDDINDPAKSNLQQFGMLPEKSGWYPEKITNDINAIILGMHAKADNPELIAAKLLGLPIFSFPEYIYEISKNKKRVVVAGSHGKTTITAMIMHILKNQGLEFDYLVGAKVQGFQESVKLSDAPLIIIEGDEYPASVEEKKPKIFFYHPLISVLSGIAWDHINVFPTYEIYLSQFKEYLNILSPNTTLIYNQEDAEVFKIVQEEGKQLQLIPYKTPVYIYQNGYPIIETNNGPLKTSVFGSHNLLNMQAAIAVCKELGITEEMSYQAIATFTGAARRLEKLIETPQLLVYRDFAHAPSKLKATLKAVREAYQDYFLIACFELHTFSSLNDAFLHEYAHSMDTTDEAIVYYSKRALQIKGLPELNKQKIKEAFHLSTLNVINQKDILIEKIISLKQSTNKPVFLLLMSSGTFDGMDWLNINLQF